MTCTWTENKTSPFGDAYYETSCGNANEFMDGDPKGNKYKYCPFCGKKIEVKKEGESNEQ